MGPGKCGRNSELTPYATDGKRLGLHAATSGPTHPFVLFEIEPRTTWQSPLLPLTADSSAQVGRAEADLLCIYWWELMTAPRAPDAFGFHQACPRRLPRPKSHSKYGW